MIDNNISSGKVENSTVLGKFCTINICAQCAREPNFLQKVSIFLGQAYFHFKTTLSNLKLHEKSFKRVFKTIRRIFDIIY